MTKASRIRFIEFTITNLRQTKYSMECDLKAAKKLVENMDRSLELLRKQIADWNEELKDLREKKK